MSKKMITVEIVAIIIIVGLGGWYYFFSFENPLVGTWEQAHSELYINETIEYDFFEDKKFLQIISTKVNQTWGNRTYLGRYEISEGKLTMWFDNNFLALALANKVHLIISGDKHLLEHKAYKDIQIVTPSEASAIIAQLT